LGTGHPPPANTTWLHAPAFAYAKYGLVLFALLLAAGVLISRRAPSRVLAAAGWACLATLIALGLNQPFGHLFAEVWPTGETEERRSRGRILVIHDLDLVRLTDLSCLG
jgi:hypothetical protein